MKKLGGVALAVEAVVLGPIIGVGGALTLFAVGGIMILILMKHGNRHKEK